MTTVIARSPASKAALAAGGLLVAGYGSYYMLNVGTVSKLEREKGDLETKAFVAQGRARRAEGNILESETLVKALQQQVELNNKAVIEVSQQLDAARLKVQQLEAQQQQKEADIQRMKADMAKAQRQREQAKSEVEQFKKESALAEKALQALNEQVAQARKQLNPLNHPVVKNFYKSK
eukprot:GHRR01005329.1.p1 GENE.GHRR01005329.1~~GHRR01005329.1.p1  ORF type:complete len:178 (+),score=53.07 GHRR01005329.1:367-900(+)